MLFLCAWVLRDSYPPPPRYAQGYQMSTMRQVAACSSRAFKLHIRDKDNFVIPFTIQSIIQGLVIGSIFWFVCARQRRDSTGFSQQCWPAEHSLTLVVLIWFV
jgi:hypothetical protein